MKKIIAITMLIGAFLISGCNTVAGFGQDIRNLGDSMSNSAERHR